MFCSSLFFDDVNSNKIEEEMLSVLIHTTRKSMIYLRAAMKETFRISNNALPISIRPFDLFFFFWAQAAHRSWRAKAILIGEVLTNNQLEHRRVSIAQYTTESPRTYLTSGHRRIDALSICTGETVSWLQLPWQGKGLVIRPLLSIVFLWINDFLEV